MTTKIVVTMLLLCVYANAAVTVTPEPGTIGTLAVGLGTLGFAAWRQRKRRK